MATAYYFYVLRSRSTDRFYTGHTENLTRRIFQHNNGRTVSIRNRGPWVLFYSEEYPTRSEAAQRERYVKSMKSHAYIEGLARASQSDREGRYFTSTQAHQAHPASTFICAPRRPHARLDMCST